MKVTRKNYSFVFLVTEKLLNIGKLHGNASQNTLNALSVVTNF